jgi:hypothetical protein
MENETNNYDFFLEKEAKIILTFANGRAITYRGHIIKIDKDCLLFHDRLLGNLLIAKKDISQILEVRI